MRGAVKKYRAAPHSFPPLHRNILEKDLSRQQKPPAPPLFTSAVRYGEKTHVSAAFSAATPSGAHGKAGMNIRRSLSRDDKTPGLRPALSPVRHITQKRMRCAPRDALPRKKAESITAQPPSASASSQAAYHRTRSAFFPIFSFCIRARSVLGFISSSSAAPPLPATRPSVMARTRRICSRSTSSRRSDDNG